MSQSKKGPNSVAETTGRNKDERKEHKDAQGMRRTICLYGNDVNV